MILHEDSEEFPVRKSEGSQIADCSSGGGGIQFDLGELGIQVNGENI